MVTVPSPDSFPEIEINDLNTVATADLRSGRFFALADPDHLVPDVILGSAPPNPMDRYRTIEQRVGIHEETGGKRVGAFTLVQTPTRTWLRDSFISDGSASTAALGLVPENRQGERLAVGAYLAVIATAHDVGRRVESDPMGLSPSRSGESPADRVWKSLVRRGVAEVVPDKRNQHGNPRYLSKPPAVS